MMNPIILEDIKHIIESTLIDWTRFKNKTVLVSGAAGFLPAYMVESLLYLNIRFPGHNTKIIGLVRDVKKAENRFSHWLSSGDLKLVQHDVVKEYKSCEDIDFIIHAASQASPKYYASDPVGTLSANVLGTINLVKLATERKVESFLYFSSGEVYGDVPEDKYPITENTFGYLDPMQVRSCYAESKRMGENICVSWHHQYAVPTKIVRPFHTYGPGLTLDDGRVFADFVADVINARNITLNSDGSARRAFCYLSDATKAFFMVLLNGHDGEAYNVGNPFEEHSIGELAKIMIGLKPELELKVIFNSSKPLAQYIQSPLKRNTPNINKITELGWSPETTAEFGFNRTVSSFDN
jgi:nucleoside-diphosphate-sugar epimerase